MHWHKVVSLLLRSSWKSKIKLRVEKKNDCLCNDSTDSKAMNTNNNSTCMNWIRLVKPLKKNNYTTFYHWNVIVIGLLPMWFYLLVPVGASYFKKLTYAMAKNELSMIKKKIPWSWAFRIECAIQYHFIHSVNDYINFYSNETKIIYCANNFQIIHAVEVKRKPFRLMYKLYHFERPTMNIDICTAGAPILLSICLLFFFCFGL